MARLSPSSATPTQPALGAAPPRRLTLTTFSSLADREFRWYFISMLGQMASMNMQLVVRGYLAFELTGSYAALGLVGLASAVPTLLLSVFGGVVADRTPKRSVLQLGQLVSLINAVAMAVLVIASMMSMEWLLLSAFAHGCMMALTMPARQAMIPEIVGMERMMNALSLNMAGMNTMRLIAPAAGGFLIEFLGFEWAFFAMAGLYGLAIFGLAHMTWQPATVPGEKNAKLLQVASSSLRDIGDGLTYIMRDRMVFIILSISYLSTLFGMPYMFLLPGYVSDIFGGGGSEVGILISISAIGSLAGALVLASLPDRHRGKLLLAGTSLLAVSLVTFALTTNFLLASVFMVVVGVGSALRQALSQGLLHTYVDSVYRGRVMAVFMTQFSLMQVGTFFVGILAEAIGIRGAFVGLGLCLLITSVLYYLLVPRLRTLH